MHDPPSQVALQVIAECGARILFEKGNELVVADRGDQWTFTTIFVLALVGFIVGLNGLLQLLLATTGDSGSFAAGIVATAVGGVATFALTRVFALRKRNRARPLDALEVVARFDLTDQTLRAPDGAVVASLTSVSLKRRFQIGSSNRMLVAAHPGGDVVIARGNPFAGDVGDMQDALTQRLGLK